MVRCWLSAVGPWLRSAAGAPNASALARRLGSGCLLAAACLLAGCSTHADRLCEIRDWYYGGHLDYALEKTDEYLKKGNTDSDVLKLERAMIDLADGRPGDAERTLREVRDRFEHLQQFSAAEGVLKMLTDDNRSAYPGEDYERILIRAFLALANLMGDGGDALAYSLQVNDIQAQIIEEGADESGENPKLNYKRVALGAYLHGVLREETFLNYDDAAHSWAQVLRWEPEFPYARADLDRALHGRHSQRGSGVLYVFTLVGRGPFKIETEEIPSTIALLAADRILSFAGKHTVAPTIAPIKVPAVVVSPNDVRAVQVSVDGRPAGETATVTDVGQLAVQQYQAIYPRVLARAVARRAVKKGIFYAAKEASNVSNGSLLNLGLDVVGVIWEATEAADTRCWGLLPDRIQVLRVELPAGQHRIGLRPAGGSSGMGPEESTVVNVSDARNTYVLANFPGDRLVGKILVGPKTGSESDRNAGGSPRL